MNEEEIKQDEVAEDTLDIELEDELVTLSREEYESLKKDASAKAQLTARVHNAEAEKKALQQNITKQNPKKDDELKQKVDSLYIAEEKRQFGYQNGLSPEETDYIFKINSAPTKELLEDPFIKGGLEAIRSVKRVEDNTPSISGRSQRFEIPNKKVVTQEDKQQAFEKYVSSLRK